MCEQDSHGRVRSEICDYIDTNQSRFGGHLADTDLTTYLTKMRRDREWGDHLVLAAAQYRYTTSIVVFPAEDHQGQDLRTSLGTTIDRERCQHGSQCECDDGQLFNRRVHISFHGSRGDQHSNRPDSGHYNAVVPHRPSRDSSPVTDPLWCTRMHRTNMPTRIRVTHWFSETLSHPPP